MMVRFLVLVTAGALAGGDASLEDAIKKDLDRLQGRWKVTRAEVNGKALPQKAFLKVVIVVKEDSITFKNGAEVYDVVTFDPDPGATPKSADLRHTSGLMKGVRERAIYELQGDVWKLCIAPRRQKRPTEFSTREGSGQQLFILKRY
jgi:uncharacterized protein (TIGR03067 family)